MTTAELDRIAAMMSDLGFPGILVDSQGCETSMIPGLHVSDHFFPASELDDADNLALLMSGMFTQILAKRAVVQRPAVPKRE